MSNAIIIGIDEAGRGPLAGPVVAAAAHLPCPVALHTKGGWLAGSCRLFDSKQLDSAERDASYRWITGNCQYGVGVVSAEDIDRIGILEATNQAMQDAVAMLAQTIAPTYLLVDGRDAFWFDYPHSSVIRGDSLEPSIAAASIIAKVTRDRMMTEYAKDFPLYSFELHKGYASPLHIEMIRAHGATPIHRRTFLTRILADSLQPVSTGAHRR